LKPLVNDFGSFQPNPQWNKRFGGLKNAILSQRIGYRSAGCRTSVRADCALQILPCSELGGEGEKVLY